MFSFLLIIGIIFFVITLIISWNYNGFFDGIVFMISLFAGLFGMLVGLLISTTVAQANIDNIINTEVRYELVEINDTYLTDFYDESRGQSRISYYYKDKNKGIVQNDIRAEVASIGYVEEGQKPYIIKIENEFNTAFLKFICGSIDTQYEFFIPLDKSS